MTIKRPGMQLLELVVSLASASLLMVGLGSSIMIAGRSMQFATTREAASDKTQAGLDNLRYDLAEAFLVTNRSADGVSLSVSDRNGDGLRESVQYRWLGGPGAPLEKSINSGAWTPITDDLISFRMNWHSSPPQRFATGAGLAPAGAAVYQNHTTAAGLLATGLSIPLPASYVAGDLVVAAVAISGNALTASGSASWQVGPQLNNGSALTLATFYSHAPAGNSFNVSWSGLRSVHGIVSHFRVAGGSTSLIDQPIQTGTSSSPAAPTATAAASNSLVVRVLAGKGGSLTDAACNMPDHVAIAFRRSLLVDPIVGMSYRYYGSGIVPSANFNLGGSAQFVTASLVFQP